MKVFADVSACGDAAGSLRAAECKTRIREHAGVSEAELAKIEAEGVERNWPPLPPILMSLDPITEAGRLLCPS